MSEIKALYDAILAGQSDEAVEAAKKAIDAKIEPLKLVDEAVGPAMNEAGKRFEEGEYFVPELLIAARATKAVFELVRPMLAKSGAPTAGKVVIGTVQGDLHDIGKNLVASMLEGGGYEVIDLGVNVEPEKFAAAAKEKGANLVGLSALLTTTMPAMKGTIEALQKVGVRDKVKVMIGGAPITQKYAEEIGADCYAENAGEVVEAAKKLLAG